MSVENAREYLKKFKLEDRVKELDSSTSTAILAAEAIECKVEQIVKSLTFYSSDGGALLVAVSGNARINNRKFKEKFGFKAKMIKKDELENLVGYSAGGVCPYGVKNTCKVYLDDSIKSHSVVYPAAGSENAVAKLSLEELEEVSDYIEWVDICND